MKYHNLIIDGHNFLYRAYYKIQNDRIRFPERNIPMINGIDTDPINQFLYMLKAMKNAFNADNVFLTWDKKLNYGAGNFRKTLTEYKAHRVESEHTHSIWNYCDIIQPFMDHMGIKTIFPYSLEADDVIAFLSKNLNQNNIIISSDRDLLQLINEHNHVYTPTKKETVTLENFEDITKVSKNTFILYKCILGDVSDNIVGLYKFGPVKSKKLSLTIANSFYDLSHDAMLIQIHSMNSPLPEWELTSEQFNLIKKNIEISWLGYIYTASDQFDAEIQSYKDQFEAVNKTNTFDGNKLKSLFNEYNFTNYVREFGQWSKMFNNSSSLNTLTKEFDFDELFAQI
jgi:5'-3' exonuclease